MTAQNAQTIFDEVTAHVQKQGGRASDWYAGITSDAEQRVFGDHKVSKENGWWIYRQATSASTARNAEKELLDWGCDGGSGGGDDSATIVYAYLKAAQTSP